jgi:hypothetical protein
MRRHLKSRHFADRFANSTEIDPNAKWKPFVKRVCPFPDFGESAGVPSGLKPGCVSRKEHPNAACGHPYRIKDGGHWGCIAQSHNGVRAAQNRREAWAPRPTLESRISSLSITKHLYPPEIAESSSNRVTAQSF